MIHTRRPRRPRIAPLAVVFALATVTFAPVAPASAAASLTPTRPALLRQDREAKAHGYTYMASEAQMRDFARRGYLVEMRGNRDYAVASWVYPYARPEVKLFVERLAAQYRAVTGERLVVTSLTRPKNRQPKNSHALSVHPTGMAMDLRVPQNAAARRWLENALLGLEGSGVLEAARERRPPHYHVVLFPRQYAQYVEKKTGQRVPPGSVAASPAPQVALAGADYRVRSGDSLWSIARRHGVTVASLRAVNDLSSTVLRPGQAISIPAAGAATRATTTAATPKTYRVRAGDNLWTIARRHDTSVSTLRRANGLASNRLKPGQVLAVPTSR